MAKKKKDNNNKVYLEFVGSNCDGVTGSCIFVQFYDNYLERNYNILLELGMMQGKSPLECYKSNMRMLDRIDFKTIDVIFCQHLHSDHTGLLASAYRRGFEGAIYTTKETKFGLTPMLNDGYSINKLDVRLLISKGVKAKTYYEEKDIERTFLNCSVVDYDKEYTLTPNITFEFITNRHSSGSSSLVMKFVDKNKNVHKMFYSSDLGNIKFEKHFINQEQNPIDNCTLGIYESTYCEKGREVPNNLRESEIEQIHKMLRYTLLEKQGHCLFPAFSYDRTPNVLWILKKILDSDEDLKDINVIVDGKLTNELLDVFSNIYEGIDKEELDELLQWDNLKRYRNYKQTECAMQNNKKPTIFMASSGMCTNGHITYYLERLLPHEENTIIFTGYSSQESPATKIKQNALLPKEEKKIVKLNQDSIITQKCDVLDLHSFSSHIMRDDLIDYITRTNMQTCVLVHGDNNGRLTLAENIREVFKNKGKTTKVEVPMIGDKMLF